MSVTSILRECHRLRRFLKALQEEVDGGPRVTKAQQNHLAREEQAHKDAHEALKKLKLKLKDDEGTLKQTEAHIAKLQTRAVEVTTMREMDATRSETTQATDKKSALEDAILTTIGEIEERTTALPAVEKQWADAKATFAAQQEEAKARLVRIQAEKAAAEAELTAAEATLPAAVRPTYLSLVKAHGPEGMAAVKERVCQSCRSSLTEQKWNQVRGGGFISCSNCGRALYPSE